MIRRVYALVAAAGQGTRLGAPVPKAYVELAGVTLLARSVAQLVAAGVDEIVVTISPDMEAAAAQALQEFPVRLVPGGGERADSVWAGLQAIAADAPLPSAVLIHDAARALTPVDMISRVIESVREGAQAVVPVLPVSDTIKVVDQVGAVVSTPDRARLRAVQTPQGFDLAALVAANERYFKEDPEFVATDDASLMEWAGHRVETVAGDTLAFKITTPLDLTLAQALVK